MAGHNSLASRVSTVDCSSALAAALQAARHLRGPRVLCDHEGKPLTQKSVQVMMRRVARRAHVKPGLHILRHTFCSHLAMPGAPARAIQALGGHQDLSTTQRYMHLSPAATEDAIRLLDERQAGVELAEKFGDILDTREVADGSRCEGRV